MIPTAVLVTRGDVDLAPIVESLPKEWPKFIWDNSQQHDYKVFGHFAALEHVLTDYVYFQDDDAICPAAELLEAWDERRHGDLVFLNERDGETPWISWGAICRRDLPMRAINWYVDMYGMSEDVLYWCDLILTQLAPWENVDLQDRVRHLPQYRWPNRMVMKPNHYDEQARIRTLCEPLKWRS